MHTYQTVEFVKSKVSCDLATDEDLPDSGVCQVKGKFRLSSDAHSSDSGVCQVEGRYIHSLLTRLWTM